MKVVLGKATTFKTFMGRLIDPVPGPRTPSGQFECDASNTRHQPLLTWSPLCMRCQAGQVE